MSSNYSMGKRRRDSEKERKKKQREERRDRKRRAGPSEIPIAEVEEVTGDLESVERQVRAQQDCRVASRQSPAVSSSAASAGAPTRIAYAMRSPSTAPSRMPWSCATATPASHADSGSWSWRTARTPPAQSRNSTAPSSTVARSWSTSRRNASASSRRPVNRPCPSRAFRRAGTP